MLDVWDHEGNSLAIYAEAKADPLDPPGPHGLAKALGVSVRYFSKLMGGAKYARVRDEECIFVRPGLPPLVEGVRIYHELAERHLRSARGEQSIEQACDQLAYHLRMPRPAFRELIACVGRDLRALAEPWPASETASALRYLEVTDTPGVVVTPREVRARGPEWVWPEVAELRRIARARKLPAGIERVRIDDRAGCALLMAS